MVFLHFSPYIFSILHILNQVSPSETGAADRESDLLDQKRSNAGK